MNDHHFETPSPIQLEAKVATADVFLEAGERTTTTVEVRPRDAGSRADCDAAERVRVTQDGGRIRVIGERGIRRTRGAYEVHVELPAGSHVELATSTGDLRARGELGTVEVQTGTGDMVVDEAARVQAATGSGDIEVAVASGPVEVKTGSGDVRIGSASGDVRCKTGTGDLRVDAADGGELELLTGTGDIVVAIPEGVAALLDLISGLGDIDNQLTSVDARPDEATGSVRVRVKTGTGDVTISRAVLVP